MKIENKINLGFLIAAIFIAAIGSYSSYKLFYEGGVDLITIQILLLLTALGEILVIIFALSIKNSLRRDAEKPKKETADEKVADKSFQLEDAEITTICAEASQLEEEFEEEDSQICDAYDYIDTISTLSRTASNSLKDSKLKIDSVSDNFKEYESAVTNIYKYVQSYSEDVTKIKELSLNPSEYNNALKDLLTDMASISQDLKKNIKSIDEIAFHTNLLSLNASVEAAKAGLHGKGFAVIADEVKDLSNKAVEAVESSSKLLDMSFDHIQRGNRLVEESELELKKPLMDIEDDSSAYISELNRIISSVEKIRQQMSEDYRSLLDGEKDTAEISQVADKLKKIIDTKSGLSLVKYASPIDVSWSGKLFNS